MRVAVYGAKHDAAMFEELLKGYCALDPAHTLGHAMIDTACLGTPKVLPLCAAQGLLERGRWCLVSELVSCCC
jgi:hypothetical protein